MLLLYYFSIKISKAAPATRKMGETLLKFGSFKELRLIPVLGLEESGVVLGIVEAVC